MQFNTEEFKKYIADEIDKSGVTRYKAPSLFMYFLMCLLCIILVGFIWMIVDFHKRKAFQKVVGNALPPVEELYKKFFELCVSSTNDEIKFNGFSDNEILKEDGTALWFEVNGEDYEFDVHEWTEIRTRTIRNPQTGQVEEQTYKVYFYETAAETFVPKAESFDLIELNNRIKLAKMFKKNKGYETESIAFNKRFNVSGDNELQVVKLLRPSVIDDFISDHKYQLPGTVTIDHGYIDTYYQSGESRVYQDMGINEKITEFALRPSLEVAMAKKMQKDFTNAFELLDVIHKLKL